MTELSGAADAERGGEPRVDQVGEETLGPWLELRLMTRLLIPLLR